MLYIHVHAVKMTLCEYVEQYMKPQTLDSLGNGNHVSSIALVCKSQVLGAHYIK